MIAKILKNHRGQAMVELVLILPILLLLIFGIIEFGRIFSTQLILANSARETARNAAVGATDEEIESIAENSASVLDISKLVLVISPEASERRRGESVSVHIEYPVKIYAPMISSFMGNSYIVSSEVIMRVE